MNACVNFSGPIDSRFSIHVVNMVPQGINSLREGIYDPCCEAEVPRYISRHFGWTQYPAFTTSNLKYTLKTASKRPQVATSDSLIKTVQVLAQPFNLAKHTYIRWSSPSSSTPTRWTTLAFAHASIASITRHGISQPSVNHALVFLTLKPVKTHTVSMTEQIAFSLITHEYSMMTPNLLLSALLSCESKNIGQILKLCALGKVTV